MTNTDIRKKKENNKNIENKVKVAIIDSGIDYSEDITVYERKNFVPGEDEVSILYEDASGHGTSVAGIIAAKENELGVTGVNENVELYSAKVLDMNNSAPVSRVIEAINWAIEKDVDIINLSLGTATYSASLDNAIKRAYNEGILLIAAAGNGDGVEYPAAFDEVMAVGAVGIDGKVCKDSAKGEELDIVAPGEQIPSTGAFDGVMVSGGTSMATPHVTGAASVLLQKNKEVPTDFIRELLCASAKCAGDENECGSGIVDLQYAMECYDEAWKEYQNRPNEGNRIGALEEIVESNQDSIECFDDVNMVEGRWSKAVHADMAALGDIVGEDLYALKMGARLQDNEEKYSSLYGFRANPQLHGYHGPYKPKTNYIACYITLTMMAQKFLKSSTYEMPAQTKGISDEDYKILNSAIDKKGVGIGSNKVIWGQVLYGQRVDNRRKAMTIYGMALHAATDVFAHSAYRNNNGKESYAKDYIKHAEAKGSNGDEDADSTEYLPNRYTCAKLVAKNILKIIEKGGKGSASDFVIDSSKYKGKFKIGGLKSFAEECGVSSSIITKMSCEVPIDAV